MAGPAGRGECAAAGRAGAAGVCLPRRRGGGRPVVAVGHLSAGPRVALPPAAGRRRVSAAVEPAPRGASPGLHAGGGRGWAGPGRLNPRRAGPRFVRAVRRGPRLDGGDRAGVDARAAATRAGRDQPGAGRRQVRAGTGQWRRVLSRAACRRCRPAGGRGAYGRRVGRGPCLACTTGSEAPRSSAWGRATPPAEPLSSAHPEGSPYRFGACQIPDGGAPTESAGPARPATGSTSPGAPARWHRPRRRCGCGPAGCCR